MSSGDPQTRLRILEATRQLVERSHGQAVRLEDIAQQAGVSRQAIYLHFGSRVGLMVATVQQVDEAQGFMERTEHVRQAETGPDALKLFVEFWADYVPSIYGLAKVLLASREADPAAAAAWADRMDGLRMVCRTLVRRLKQQGRLDSLWTTDEAAQWLWSLISIQMWENLVVESGWSKQRYVDRLQNVLLRTLITAD